jgi:hypothetical protein
VLETAGLRADAVQDLTQHLQVEPSFIWTVLMNRIHSSSGGIMNLNTKLRQT